MPTHDLETVIVGAGICGLTLARHAAERGARVRVLEKSKGVGGRMATRRANAFVFDHGAQFFKHSPKDPFPWMARWLANGNVATWFVEGDTQFNMSRGGMTALAKDLAEDLPIQCNQRVTRLVPSQGRVQIGCESGVTVEASRVILTCPVPQSLDLLRASALSYPKELEAIPYAKALVGLFSLAEPAQEFERLKYLKASPPIISIANNLSKGLGRELALTVVMDPQFSEKFFDAPDSETLSEMRSVLQSQFRNPLTVGEAQLKKWRFSHPEKKWSQPHFDVLGDRQVILAGDGFGGGSLSGAVRSALSVCDLVGW